MAKKTASTKEAGETRTSLPLTARSVDLLISFYYIIFIFTVSFTDLHNFTASVLRVEVKDLENMDLAYPPKFLTDLYFKWARTVDPLLYENPMWWQAIEWVNLLVLTPYALLAVIGFPLGWRWLRNPGMIVSSFTAYSLAAIIPATLFGNDPTPNPHVFCWVYIPYAIFPLLIILRLWGERPFETKLSGFASTIIWLVGTVTLALFFTYCLKWFVVYEPGMLPSEVLDVVKGPMDQLPGGVLFALMKGVPPFNKAAWRLWWTSFLQLVPFALQTWHRTQGGGGISSHAEAQQSATTTVAATHRVPPQRMPPARPKKPSRRAFWRRWWASLPGLCAIGCVLALHFGAWSWSVNHTTLARSLLFVTTHPMLGVLGSLSAAGILLIARHTCGTGLWPSAWHPRWPTGLELLGTTVALAGAAAMVLPDADEGTGANSSAPSLAGDAAAVLGAAAMAVYLWAGAAARKWQPLWLYAFPVTLSAAVTASLASWAAEPGISLAGSGGLGLFGWAAGGRLTTLAFLSGFVSGILGHSLAILALAHLPPLIVSVSLLLEPLLGSLIGWALGEQGVPSAWTALGGSLLLMGVAAITVGQPPVADSGGGPDTPVCVRSDAGRPKAGRPAVRAV